jgi:hypothetical protein
MRAIAAQTPGIPPFMAMMMTEMSESSPIIAKIADFLSIILTFSRVFSRFAPKIQIIDNIPDKMSVICAFHPIDALSVAHFQGFSTA